MKHLLALIVIQLLFGKDLFANKEYTWNGNTSSNWGTVSNWDDDPNTNFLPNSIIYIKGPTTYANAPVISSTPSFSIDNMDVSGQSLLTMTGGTINFTGNVGIRGGSDLILSGGTMNITGNLYLIDVGSSITVSGGDLNVGGDILMGVTDGVTGDSTDGATNLTVSSGGITCSNLVYDNTTGDNHTVTMTGGSIAVSGDIRSDGEDVIINMSNLSVITVGDDISMTGGNDLITMTNGVIEFGGDWINNGSTNLSGGLIRLNGSLSQSISNASGGETFYTLSINNSLGGVSLNDSIIIENILGLSNGIITTNGNSVTLIDNTTVVGGGTTSFIDGPVNKIGNNAFTFPIGDGIFYSPVTISSPNTVTSLFRAEYFRTNPDGLYPLANRVAGIATVSQIEYWEVNRLVDASPSTVTLNWSATSLVGNLVDLKVLRWDDADSEWKDEGNGGTTGTTSSGTIQSSGTITDFSPFTLGSSSISNPLPVELINFKVEPIGDHVLINWSTAAEINNNHYEIQKTIDGKSIYTIASIASKADGGNSTEINNYSYHDLIDFKSSAYYRLVQYDHDGTKKEYPFLAVNLNNSNTVVNSEKPMVYPNPIAYKEFKLSYDSESIIDLYLFGINGQEVSISYSKIDSKTYKVALRENVNSGIYFMNVVDRISGKVISSERIIIQ